MARSPARDAPVPTLLREPAARPAPRPERRTPPPPPAQSGSDPGTASLSTYNGGFLNNRPIYWLGQWLLENFEPDALYPLTRAFGELMHLTMGRFRRQVRANMLQVLRHLHPELSPSRRLWQAVRTTHRVFWNRADMYTDHALLTSRRTASSLAHYELTADASGLSSRMAAGKGAILASAHLGNWHEGSVITSRWLGSGRGGPPLRTLRFKNPRQARLLEGFARRARLRQTTITDQADPFLMVDLVRGLRQGEMLALLADIPWDYRWVEVPFFGRPARFPVGPARLARLAEVPLYPAFCVWKKRRHFVSTICEPIEVRGPDPAEAERRAVARFAAVLEGFVADNLDQWFNFNAVW